MSNSFAEGTVPSSSDTKERSLQKINDILALSGGQYIGGTDTVSGSFSAIQVISEAKLHTLTGNVTGVANTSSGSAPTIPLGIVLYGDFTAVKLHSGSIVVYND